MVVVEIRCLGFLERHIIVMGTTRLFVESLSNEAQLGQRFHRRPIFNPKRLARIVGEAAGDSVRIYKKYISRCAIIDGHRYLLKSWLKIGSVQIGFLSTT